jgi:hypothetical protein
MILRHAANKAMAGKAWTFGPVGLDLTICAPQLAPGYTLVDYLGGVMDTLDGSSGYTFTFLPIVYEDDCQVVISNTRFVQSESVHYTLRVTFLTKESTADTPRAAAAVDVCGSPASPHRFQFPARRGAPAVPDRSTP